MKKKNVFDFNDGNGWIDGGFDDDDITLKPTDEQLEMLSEHNKLAKEFNGQFYCFLKDGSVVYKFEDEYVLIKNNNLNYEKR